MSRLVTSSTSRILKVWLPSAMWLAVIVLESTNLGSAEHTSRILYPIFRFSIRNGSCTFCCVARLPSQDRAFCWLLHTGRSSVSLLACDFSAAQHTMVSAMGYSCVLERVACFNAR